MNLLRRLWVPLAVICAASAGVAIATAGNSADHPPLPARGQTSSGLKWSTTLRRDRPTKVWCVALEIRTPRGGALADETCNPQDVVDRPTGGYDHFCDTDDLFVVGRIPRSTTSVRLREGRRFGKVELYAPPKGPDRTLVFVARLERHRRPATLSTRDASKERPVSNLEVPSRAILCGATSGGEPSSGFAAFG